MLIFCGVDVGDFGDNGADGNDFVVDAVGVNEQTYLKRERGRNRGGWEDGRMEEERKTKLMTGRLRWSA